MAIVSIEHPQLTSAERRKAIDARVKAGLPLGASHNWQPQPGAQAIAMGTLMAANEYTAYAGGSFRKADQPLFFVHPPRRKVERPICHGKEVACLPGKNGKCVACADDD